MCPSCHSNEISRSRKKKLRDRFMRWMGKVAYRCRECHRRFYVSVDVHRRLKSVQEWQERSAEHVTSSGRSGGHDEEDLLEDYGSDTEE